MPVPLIALVPCALVTLVSAGYAYSQYERRCEERAGYRDCDESDRIYKRIMSHGTGGHIRA